MNREQHRVMRESLGAYALGGLPDAELAGVRAHLDGCAGCRAELALIAPVATALRGADPDHLDDSPVPPPWLGERIVAAARAEGTTARPRGRVPAVAAAVVLAGVIGGGLGFVAGSPPAVPREQVTVDVVGAGIDASASVVPHTWGTEITLTADGFATGAVYRVVVRDDQGRVADAGQFIGTGVEPMVCNLNSSVLRARAVGFEVLDDSGSVVLHGDL